MLMGILQLLYNAADLIVVGNFGGDKTAIGAIGSTSSLISLTVNLFMGLSVGTNVTCAKYFGAKNNEKISKVVHTSILLSLIMGIGLGALGFIFADDLLTLMKNDLELSRVYLKIYFIGMPFNLVYNFAAAVLRAVGDTKRPLYFLSIAGLVNIILNIISVVVFKMGVAGVAYATIASQFVSCILIMITLCKTKECYRFSFNQLKINKRELFEILKIGLPAGIQSSIFSISNVIIQTSINRFNYIVMNGNTAASSVEDFVYVSMESVYHASLPFTSQNVGAKKTDNIKKITAYSLIIVTLIAVIFGGTLFIFGKQALSIYTKVPDEIEVGYIRLHYLCLPYFLCGIMDVMVGILRGMGYSTLPMIISIIGICGFRISWIYGYFYQHTNFTDYKDLNLLYVSYPISWIITFLVQLTCYLILSKTRFKQIENDLILESLS